MPRYIDADKVLAEFPIRRNHYDTENGDIKFINGIETVMEYIDTIADETPAVVFYQRKPIFEYCPHCGAKMDGEQK